VRSRLPGRWHGRGPRLALTSDHCCGGNSRNDGVGRIQRTRRSWWRPGPPPGRLRCTKCGS
jgi:hypothetical protein